MSGQATGRRVTLCRMIRKRTGIREYLTRDLELSRAPLRRGLGGREEKKSSKKLIEFYHGPVYRRPHTSDAL